MAELKFYLPTGFSLSGVASKSAFLAFLIIALQISATIGQDCLRCDDFNREKNSTKECALKSGDCGPCKSGFIEDPDDVRLCFAIELLEGSEDINKARGADVYLPCKFNAAINCVWTNGGTEVIITDNENYRWTNNGDGTNTDDCSINILALSFDEVGEWQCSNRANSEYDSVKSSLIEISIRAKVEDHPGSTYKVGSGEKVQVPCKFDQAVKCSWVKNGNPILSRGNYIFNERVKSQDCSLTINSFDMNKDQGNWTCLTPASSEANAIVANTAFLFADPNSMKEPPKTAFQSEDSLKPIISYKSEVVNRKILELSYLSSENLVNGLRCMAENGNDAVSLNWLVQDDVEYPGLRIGNSIYVDKIITTNIIDRLKMDQSIDLFCLVKYANQQTELSMVTLTKSAQFDEFLEPIDTANINTLLMVLIVVIVILMGGILGAVICLACYFMRNRNKSGRSNKSDSRGSTCSQTKLLGGSDNNNV